MSAVRVIAVANQKGGVGKTTTVANLGAALARAGLCVGLIDLDPQANLTMHFGVEPGSPPASIYDVLTAGLALGRATMIVQPNLLLVPSVIDLAAAEIELAGAVGRERILRDRLAEQHLPTDLILLDCPPSLGLLTLNALAAADEVLIPLQPHFLPLQGLGKLLETVALVQKRINPPLRVGGVVFVMYEGATRLAGEVVQDVQAFFEQARTAGGPWSGVRVFSTRVRRNIKLAECPSFGTTIHQYDPASHGATDYSALAAEFMEHFGLAPRQAEAAPAASAEAPVAREQPAAPAPANGSAEPHAAPPAPPEAGGGS